MSRKRTPTNLVVGQNICGQEIRRRRGALGLSQESFAVKAQVGGWNITRGLVAKVESGERGVSDDELMWFAFFLNCSPNDLLNWPRVPLVAQRGAGGA